MTNNDGSLVVLALIDSHGCCYGLSPSLPNPASVTSDDKRTYRGIQEGIHPSPVVQLNRAVAIAMCEGPEAGLAHIDAVLEHGELLPGALARADMYRRLGRTAEARSS
jgi:hypothetical protein